MVLTNEYEYFMFHSLVKVKKKMTKSFNNTEKYHNELINTHHLLKSRKDSPHSIRDGWNNKTVN